MKPGTLLLSQQHPSMYVTGQGFLIDKPWPMLEEAYLVLGDNMSRIMTQIERPYLDFLGNDENPDASRATQFGIFGREDTCYLLW